MRDNIVLELVPAPLLSARRRIPEPEPAGVFDCRHRLPIRRECDLSDSDARVADFSDDPSRGRVPDVGRAPTGYRDQGLAIRSIEGLPDGLTVVESEIPQSCAGILRERLVETVERIPLGPIGRDRCRPGSGRRLLPLPRRERLPARRVPRRSRARRSTRGPRRS